MNRAVAAETTLGGRTVSDWQPNYPFPKGGNGVFIEVRYANGSIDRMPLMESGQWSDSHYGDLLSAYPRGAIIGWRYATERATDTSAEGQK